MAHTSPGSEVTMGAALNRALHDASVFGGDGAEVAARVTEQCFHHLQAPVLRVGGWDVPYPPPKLEEHHLPGVDRIPAAVDRLQWESEWVEGR